MDLVDWGVAAGVGKHLNPDSVINLTRELVSVPSDTAEGEELIKAVNVEEFGATLKF